MKEGGGGQVERRGETHWFSVPWGKQLIMHDGLMIQLRAAIYVKYKYMRLGLEERKSEKKGWPAQPEWPKQDREILRRCMSRSPYKPRAHPVWTRSPCYGVSPLPTSPGT
jgi:hypothetical protein